MTRAEDVKRNVPILEAIRRYRPQLQLHREGNRFKGLCPFHNETQPSFVVYPKTQTYHCFGACAETGDVIRFVERLRQCDFKTALRLLADDFNLSNGDARKHEAERLSARAVIEKLKRERGLRQETIAHFSIVANADRQCWEYPVVMEGKTIGRRAKAFDSEADPKYRWIPKMSGPVVYGLDDLDGARECLLVNGEPAVWVCRQAGVKAVCTCTGENDDPTESLKILAAHGVKLLRIPPDLDETGQQSASKRKRIAKSLGMTVIIHQLPEELGRGGDLCDLYRKCHFNDEAFRKTLRELPEAPERTDRVSARDFDEWEPPVPFQDFKLPPFPTDALPCWLREFVDAVSIATQTPPDLCAMLVLSTCAAACAKKIDVCVRRGFIEPLNLYTVVSLPPGNRKSAVFREATAPLDEFEEAEAKRMAPEIAAAATRYKIADLAHQKAQQMAARTTGEERKSLIREAEKMAQELQSLEVPPLPRLIADDSTPERLTTLLRDQGGRMAVMSAEGGVFDLMAGRYSSNGAPNFEVYLKGHSGDTLRVDRVNRPPEYVKEPALTIGLTVQPEVIRGLAQKPGFRGRGLLGRFLYSLPESPLGHRRIDPPVVPDEIRTDYRIRMLSLLDLPFAEDGGGNRVCHYLCLAPDAYALLREFEGWVEPQLDPFAELGMMTDWGGKLVGAVVRIMGILHVATHAGHPAPWSLPITSDTVEHAIRIGRYLLHHAKAAYGEMGADPEIDSARYLLAWIIRTKQDSFTKRTAFESTKGKFKRVPELEPVLSLLIEHGYIRERHREDSGRPGRKPSPTYDVNPHLLADSANCANCASGSTDLGAGFSGTMDDLEEPLDSNGGCY